MPPAVLLVAAYALGSIPFSFLVARVFGVRDVRSVGSGNVGATNVLRTAGRLPGAIAFLLDASKGVAAVLLAQRLSSHPWPPLAAGAAILGHMYPPWLSFRGGKGVATAAGAFLPFVPMEVGLAMAAFAATTLVTRVVSLGSIAGSIALAALVFFRQGPGVLSGTVAAAALLIVWKHRGNVRRLMSGEERPLGAGRE